MLSAAFSLLVGLLAGPMETPEADISISRFYYATRLIAALLVATLVPLLIDRRARRSTN
jgi:hypothetical protein